MVNIDSSSLFVCYWSTQLGQGNGTSLTPKGWPSCPSTFISKRWLLNHANLSWSVVMWKKNNQNLSFFFSRFHHASVPPHLGILIITTLHQDFCDSRNMPSGRRNSDSFIPSWDCFQSGQGLVDIFWLGDVERSILRNDISTSGKLVVWIGGLDSWDSRKWNGLLLRGTPIRIRNHRAPNHQFTISWDIQIDKTLLYLPKTFTQRLWKQYPETYRNLSPRGWEDKCPSPIGGMC